MDGGRTWRRASAGGDAALKRKALTPAAVLEAALLAAAVYFTAVGAWVQLRKMMALAGVA